MDLLYIFLFKFFIRVSLLIKKSVIKSKPCGGPGDGHKFTYLFFILISVEAQSTTGTIRNDYFLIKDKDYIYYKRRGFCM